MHRITVIPGDGIGPEITLATRRMVEAAQVDVTWDIVDCGEPVREREGTVCPDYVLDSIRQNKVALKGPMINFKCNEYVSTHWTVCGRSEAPVYYPSVNNAIRRALDCDVCIRLADTFHGVPSVHKDMHVVIVRELQEDVYAGSEYTVRDEYSVALKVITRRASERAAKYAFDYARSNGRKRVTAVHKANVLKQTDGLFLRCCEKVACDYPDIEFTDMMIDACAARLGSNPEGLDVLVMPNQYGDIISDLCAALVGGLGMGPGVNIGEHAAIFEATHGAAPDIAGMNLANPTALMLSGVMMLRHINENRAAEMCEEAIRHVLADPNFRTRDLGGKASTSEYTDAVCKRIHMLINA